MKYTDDDIRKQDNLQNCSRLSWNFTYGRKYWNAE